MTPQETAEQIISMLGHHELEEKLQALRPQLSISVMTALGHLAHAAQIRDGNEGLQIANLSMQVAKVMGDEEANIKAVWYQGNAYLALNQYQEALSRFHQAEQYYLTKGNDPIRVAGLQINQSLVLRELGEYGQALILAEKARTTCAGIHSEQAEIYLANLDTNIGAIYEDMGEFKKALVAYEHGREIYIRYGEYERLAKIELNRAHLFEVMDRFSEAESLLLETRKIFVNTKQKPSIARTDLNLGRVAFRKGQYQLALTYFEQAHDGFAAIPLPLETAVVDLNRLPVYLKLNLFSEMINIAAKIIPIFRLNQTQKELFLTLYYQGIGYARLGSLELARKCLDKARLFFYRQDARYRLWLVDIDRAELAWQAGHTATAHRIARRVENQITSSRYPALAARLHLLLARCKFALKPFKLAEARRHTTLALEIAKDYYLYELQIQGHYLMSHILAALGEKANAWETLQQALQTCEYVRTDLLIDEFQLGYLEDVKPVYEESVDWATSLVKKDKLTPAQLLFYLNQSQKAPLLDTGSMIPDPVVKKNAKFEHQLNELRQTWHWYHQKFSEVENADEDIDIENIKNQLAQVEADMALLGRRDRVRRSHITAQTDVREYTPETLLINIQKQMESDEILLHLFESSDMFQGLILTRETCVLCPDIVAVKPLQQQLKAWRYFVQLVQSHEQFETSPLAKLHLTQFHKLLWSPLEPYLQEKEFIYLVLPAAWQELPVAAFFNGRQHLVERWQITYLTSVEALLTKSGKNASLHSTEIQKRKALICGFSDSGRIPQTIREAEAVSAALTDRWQIQLVIEDALTWERLAEEASTSHLLHLATHAVFRPDNPLFSWLALADTRFLIADLYTLPLKKRPLVILSGCETGRGQPRGGGLLGMGRTFLSAGAAELILTLWRVEDHSSADLMTTFYDVLGQQADFSWRQVATALRTAQLTAVADGRAPFSWAGYIFLAG